MMGLSVRILVRVRRICFIKMERSQTRKYSVHHFDGREALPREMPRRHSDRLEMGLFIFQLAII